MIVNSKLIKAAVLGYYKFKRGMYSGTECYVSYGMADVLACKPNKKMSVEVEIKISISDLRADFKSKLMKHSCHHYEKAANYFYFCIPDYLIEKAEPIIVENNSKYGIMVFDSTKDYQIADPHTGISIHKRAKKLNSTSNDGLFDNIIKRNNSELVMMYYNKIKEV